MVDSEKKDSDKYVGALSRHLHLEPAKKKEIISELADHLEDKASDLVESGLNQEAALSLAMQQMGDPVVLARRIREVHYIVCLKDIGLAVIPYLLLAGLVAVGLCHNVLALGIAVAAVGAVTWLTWSKGFPTIWSYSWLGFTLASPAIFLLLVLVFPEGILRQVIDRSQFPLSSALLALLAVYSVVAGWFLVRVIYRIARQGWVVVVFSAFPVTVLTGWALIAEIRDVLAHPQGGLISENGLPWSLAFLTIAGFIAWYLKLGPRSLRGSQIFLYSAVLILVACGTLLVSYHLLPLRLIIASFLAMLLLAALRSPLAASLRVLQSIVQTTTQLIGR